MPLRTTNQENQEQEVYLTGILSEFRQAIQEEIAAVEKNGQSSTLLRDGRPVESRGPEFWYKFSVEYMPSLPADTPCDLKIGQDKFDVIVISVEENSIIISSKVKLPESIGNARLENGSTIINRKLIKRIEEKAETDNPAGHRMLSKEMNGTEPSFARIESFNENDCDSSLNDGQKKAVRAALTNDITYIWGPPGTGKTTVIGEIVNELRLRDRSVLIVSHTNTAVDGAIEKAYKAYKNDNKKSTDEICPILRVGSPVKELDENVLLKTHIESWGRDILRRKEEIEKRKSEIAIERRENSDKIEKINWLSKNRLDDLNQRLISAKSLEALKLDGEKQLEKKKQEYQKELDDNPAAGKYISEKGRYEAIKKNIAQIASEIESLTRRNNECKKNLDVCGDEIAKHNVYDDLVARQKKCMSASYLAERIINTKDKIESLLKQQTELQNEQQKHEAVIADYNRRNSVTRIFIKNQYDLASKKLPVIQEELKKREDELALERAMYNDYRLQDTERQKIERLISECHPSKTKGIWESDAEDYKREIASTDKSLSTKKSFLGEQKNELARIEKNLIWLKKAYDKLQAMVEDINKAQSDLSEKQHKYIVAKVDCQNRLEEELTAIARFNETVNEDTATVAVSDLFRLRQKVKNEVGKITVESLEKKEKDLTDELSKLAEELKSIAEKLQQLEEIAINGAKVVGATLVKTFLSDIIQKRQFDTVILDEASMASIPALWCAAYTAARNIIIVGDFLQLAPIVQADDECFMAQKWLGRDIFNVSGMQQLAYAHQAPENFIMLNQQFRMESEIANISNDLYYGSYGGLHSNDHAEKRCEARKGFQSWSGLLNEDKPVEFINTASLNAWATGIPTGRKKNSRMNCFNAVFDVHLAFTYVEKAWAELQNKKTEAPAVLIIAPYKPHVVYINKLIDLEYKARNIDHDSNLVKAGTVHSFQGSEADIVIFDLVVDQPHSRAGVFMKDPDMNTGYERMFNVAVTRARFKLYVVGNLDFFHLRAKDNAMSRFLDEAKGKKILDAKEMYPDLVFTPSTVFSSDKPVGKKLCCKESDFFTYFQQDLIKFRSRIIIFSPFITENRIATLLPIFADAINSGKQVLVITKAPSDRKEKEKYSYALCEEKLTKIGVRIIHKKDMHEKLILIDDRVYWNGSLNCLSFTGNTGEIMIRYEDTEMTKELEKQNMVDGLIENAYTSGALMCPICGSSLYTKEGRYGGYFWACEKCDYTRNYDAKPVVEGKICCPECNQKMTFTMKKTPYWECKAHKKKQAIKIMDLGLESMRQEVPKDQLREVLIALQTNRRFDLKSDEAHILGDIALALDIGGKPVAQYSSEGKLLFVFPSVKSANAITGINENGIRDTANGTQKMSGGCYWKTFTKGEDIKTKLEIDKTIKAPDKKVLPKTKSKKSPQAYNSKTEQMTLFD